MIKQLRSWWKDTEIPNLIGRKKGVCKIYCVNSQTH